MFMYFMLCPHIVGRFNYMFVMLTVKVVLRLPMLFTSGLNGSPFYLIKDLHLYTMSWIQKCSIQELQNHVMYNFYTILFHDDPESIGTYIPVETWDPKVPQYNMHGARMQETWLGSTTQVCRSQRNWYK